MHPAIVLLHLEEGLDAPVGALTALLAESLASNFNDATLLIRVGQPAASIDDRHEHAGPPSLAPSTSIAGPISRTASVTHQGGLAELDLPLPADARRAALVLRDKVTQLFKLFAYVFIDASERSGPFRARLVEEIAALDLGRVLKRLVHVTHGAPGRQHELVRPAARSFPEGWSVLVTRLLDAVPERDAPPSRKRWIVADKVDHARRMTKRFLERLGGAAIEPRGERYPEARVSPDQCRVRIDPASIAGPSRRLSSLSREVQSSFARWARALTWRRVGVALGGSGAWGYAHIALMRQLEANGVPIDLLGGSSSGSVMGAFYCVLGAEGLELAINRGPRIARLVLLSTITSTAIDLGADAELGGVLLEDLEILFLPVATNLSRSRAEVITRSTVASAVRASASAPGVFASTITRSGLYVDGAVSDNVPVVLVERMGADLLVACNPLPPPPSLKVRVPDSPFGDFLAELNPWNRLRDLRVSFELMLHDFGDCEEAETRVVYEPPPDSDTLFGTFNFGRARSLVDAVEREPSFRETIHKSVEAYKKLAAPRSPAH